MLKLLILLCASVLQANAIPDANLDNSILEDILRNARSDNTANDIEAWPELLQLPELQNYRNIDRIQLRKKHHMQRKTMAPVNLYRQQRIKFKERMEKRQRNVLANNPSNAQKLVVCHFKLCNMVGKNMLFKKSYADWREPVEQ